MSASRITSGGRAMQFVAVYFVAAFTWGIVASILVELIRLALGLSRMSSGLMGFATAFQLTGLAAISVGLALLARLPLRDAIPTQMPKGLMVGLAVVGGLTVGIFPGWLQTVLVDVVPAWSHRNTIDLIRDLLVNGSAIGSFSMLLAVCVAAPVLEEVVFRGVLWNALQKHFHPVVPWLVTSFLFALSHLDAIQSTAVFFTGLYLGWMRWVSGSIWPAILCHAINNILAAVLVFSFDAESTVTVPLWLGLLAGSFTIGLGGVGWAARHQEPMRE